MLGNQDSCSSRWKSRWPDRMADHFLWCEQKVGDGRKCTAEILNTKKPAKSNPVGKAANRLNKHK